MNLYPIVRSVWCRCWLGLLLSGIPSACFQEPFFPDTPQIHFEGFSKYTLPAGAGVGRPKRDSLVITLGFTDGNGDLGNSLPISSQEMAQYMQAGGWGNYKIRTFRLENKQYKEQPSGENTFLVFPFLTREGKKSAIRGSLDLRQSYPYSIPNKLYPTKFRIQIRDRALHVSNEIETDTINLLYSY